MAKSSSAVETTTAATASTDALESPRSDEIAALKVAIAEKTLGVIAANDACVEMTEEKEVLQAKLDDANAQA